MTDEDLREIAERTVVALAAVGLGSVAGPDGAAAALVLTPTAELLVKRVGHVIGPRRRRNAAQTLTDAAREAGAVDAGDLATFVRDALSDEGSAELLMRGLSIAQDCALRAKRRAAGRSIAAGVADKGTKVEPELLFLRTLDDLDAPHFRVLALMSQAPPHRSDPDRPRAAVPVGWTPTNIAVQDPGMAETVKTLLAGLVRHNLVQGPSSAGITLADKNGELPYSITDYGRRFIERMAEPLANCGDSK